MDNHAFEKENGNVAGSPVHQKKAKLPPIGSSKPKVGQEPTGEQQPEERHFHAPFFYARWIVKYPKTIFFITLGLHIFMLFLLVVLSAAGVSIAPLVFEQLPLDLRSNEEYLKGLAWTNRETNDILDRSATADVQTERTEPLESIEWYFEIPGGNVLKKKHLKDMEKVEDKLWSEDKFQDKFCMTTDGSTCIKPQSILRLFDGTYTSLDSVFNDPDYDDVVTVINRAEDFSSTKMILDNALGNGADIDNNDVEVSIVRGSMVAGSPLDGYDSVDDKNEKQLDDLEEYYQNTFIDLATKYYDNGAGAMDFYFASNTIIGLYIQNTVFRDIALVAGSLLFIFLFMWFQTRSLFITFFAIFSIANGFVITDILYIGVFGIKYLGIFHVLSLFIVLGIGADDVFVFMDTWTEAGHREWPSLEHRLDHTYRHAGMAMLYTSLTTALAFFVSGASPMLAINSFGIFSGMLVIINYFSVILYLPAVVVMYHNYFAKFKCCCCCPKEENKEISKKKNIIVRFFSGPYFWFITHKIIRFVILGVFAVLVAVFIYFATTLEVQEEQVKFLPESTNIGAYLEKNAEEFGTGEFPQRLFLVWGLKEQDISNCHFTDTDCTGKTRFNNKLQMNNDDAQQSLLDFCSDLEGLSDSKIKDLKIKVNSFTNLPEVDCFVQEMEDFLDDDEDSLNYNTNTNSYSPRYPGGTDLTYPVDETVVTTIMDNVNYIYDPSELPNDYSRWFEIAMSHWLYNGFQVSNTTEQVVLGAQYAYYNGLLGVSDEDYTVTVEDPDEYLYFTYKYGTRLRYIAITVNLTLNPLTLGYPSGLPVRDEWQSYMNKKMKDMPSELKHGFQCTPPDYYGFNLWHWLYQQEALTTSATQGIIIGLCVAFPILVIATMNIFVGMLATLTIALVVLSVIAFIPIVGWKLGVLESLNLVLVVGLSVDYCVHLAEGYARCKKDDRLSRTQSALEEVGISVLSGACTTLGASFFLMLAIIIFFVKFGIFMFITICFSILYSLVFFMTVLGLIGPQGEFGSIRVLIRKIKACCCKKKSEDSDKLPHGQA